jgi:hypothetical protein
MKNLTITMMAARAPSKEQIVSPFALFPGSTEPVQIKFEWLRIVHLVPNLKAIGKVAAESGAVFDEAESLTYAL